MPYFCFINHDKSIKITKSIFRSHFELRSIFHEKFTLQYIFYCALLNGDMFFILYLIFVFILLFTTLVRDRDIIKIL